MFISKIKQASRASNQLLPLSYEQSAIGAVMDEGSAGVKMEGMEEECGLAVTFQFEFEDVKGQRQRDAPSLFTWYFQFEYFYPIAE